MSELAHLYKEVKTVPDGTDRMRYTNHMELFAVINTLQCLEMAYSQDYVNYADYAKACNKLLNQYKVRFRQLASEFHTVEEFASRYKMVCPAALERIKEGRPITMHDSTVTRNMQFVEFAITIMDKLRLNVVSVDVITPDLRNLYDILCKMSVIPDNYTGKDMMQGWSY
ncbi:hypothetical protein CRM22_007198 [Opisthorchis felineus]|uniref:Vacuolar protein sorting-associated protein 28 homolog n=1 Tax=Opisthorchis felineus TaxID=147828 RepID=A0A4S2LH60_OPIFE|nr:hypothetical protein CRM22_007198 [Opisthorchis felineus]TGZ62876.1 hypothetical protein CRM22_007198 [Opisthorchis felineus]